MITGCLAGVLASLAARIIVASGVAEAPSADFGSSAFGSSASGEVRILFNEPGRVSLGSNRVISGRQSRPLDVPRITYKGMLLPPRVILESLGAYVRWEPSHQLVKIRYAPATPLPVPARTSAPAQSAVSTPVPTPTTTATAIRTSFGFIQVGDTVRGKIYNEFSSAQNTKGLSYVVSGGYAFDPFAIKFDYREDEDDTAVAYNVPSGPSGPLPCTTTASFAPGTPITCFATIDHGYIGAPQFRLRQSTIDGRLELKVANPHYYVGGSYLRTSTNYGYPHLRSVGFGLEKLPDFTLPFGVFGSVFYYPRASGTYTLPSGPNAGSSFSQLYRVLKYDIGLTLPEYDIDLTVPEYGSQLYLYFGFSGDQYDAKQNAPINQTHSGAYIGVGIQY